MSRYAKPMSQVLAEMQEAKKITKKERDKLENDNQHGELALKLAQSFGTPQEVKKIKDINKRHMQKGSIDPKDQAERDKISNKYYKMAESIEEGYESEVLKVLDDAGIDGYFRNGKLYVDKRDAKAAKSALEDADNIMKLPKMVKEEVEDLDEMFDYVLLDKDNKIVGRYSGKNAKKEAESGKKSAHLPPMRIPKAEVSKMKVYPISPKDKKDIGDMVLAIGEALDPADIDLDATDADKKAADKNMVMQMRKALDVKGNMKIEFGDGKKEKVDPKILQMMVTAHGKIQKPRDKEKFVAMISKSKRDMLMVAKKLATLKMELDKEDEPIVKKVVQMLKKASGAHAGQAKDLEKAIKETLDIKEGTWKMPDNPKEIAALKKLMSRPLPIGNTEDDDKYKDSASSKLYSLLGDDELFDALGALEDKGKEKADARPVIIKWFQKRAKDNSYDLGDRTKELGKQIGLKMEYVPEGLDENYRKLAMMGIGTETKKAARVGLKTDYYLPKNGDKSFGKITRVTSSGYEITDEKTKKVHKFKFYDPNNDPTSVRGTRESVELDEKYELYHKSFSDAMQHAYDYAKKKLGITVDPKEIDNKVATGPKKPSEGKTNKYRLKGKGGNLQIQVYNKGGSKPFELNMYKEENDMTKSLKDTVLEMWTEASEGFASDAQRKAAFAQGYKAKGKKKDKDEGNAFTGALKAAKEKGEKTFTVAGKTYDVKTEKLVGGQKKLDKDKDGDIDGKDFAILRKQKKESFERYHQTKQGSLRDAVLQMWGEGLKKDEKKDLTKEKKDGTKNMTDTGKEVTPVDMSVKMPKIKETKNKV